MRLVGRKIMNYIHMVIIPLLTFIETVLKLLSKWYITKLYSVISKIFCNNRFFVFVIEPKSEVSLMLGVYSINKRIVK